MKQNDFVTQPLVFPSVLPPEDCRRINDFALSVPPGPSALGIEIEGYRRAESRWIRWGTRREWLFSLLGELLTAANRFYRFEISRVATPILHVTYRRGGRFGWHLDAAEGSTSLRKLSLSIQLSASDAYVGGQLEFIPGHDLPLAGTLGTVVVFPSFVPHRVRRIERGARRALVAWGIGHHFK